MTFVITSPTNGYVAEKRTPHERYTWLKDQAEKFPSASQAAQVQGNEEHVVLLTEELDA